MTRYVRRWPAEQEPKLVASLCEPAAVGLAAGAAGQRRAAAQLVGADMRGAVQVPPVVRGQLALPGDRPSRRACSLDGIWFASAMLRPDVGAVGQGDSREAAYDDLRRYPTLQIEETGVPEEMILAIEA